MEEMNETEEIHNEPLGDVEIPQNQQQQPPPPPPPKRSYIFVEPKREVKTPGDIVKWQKSIAYQEIMGFLSIMNYDVSGKSLQHKYRDSVIVSGISSLLDEINDWVDEFPPFDQPQRYGNKAFRQFYEKLKQNAEPLLKKYLAPAHHKALIEICPYLVESFGNSTRIDYGTGHELSFIMFLCALHKIGALRNRDRTATVIILFQKYITLCRKLQMTYKMEPAGSQGVWSLDDYQFIPFIWGSAQLIQHPKIKPEMFTRKEIVAEYADQYLFMSSIQYILSVKSGPFAEHSNQLWNISGVGSWDKINQGLFKMYKAEILSKFPIIQHVLFGSIFNLSPAPPRRPPMRYIKNAKGVEVMSTVDGDFPIPRKYGVCSSDEEVEETIDSEYLSDFARNCQNLPLPPQASVKEEKDPTTRSGLEKIVSPV